MIRTGDVFKFETLGEALSQLNITHSEVGEAFPDQIQDELINTENEVRTDNDEPHTNNVSDVHTDIIEQKAIEYGLVQTIIDVLDNRDIEYVHLYNNPIHTVVELDPQE